MLFFRKIISVMLLFSFMAGISACSVTDMTEKKVSDIGYTVISEEELPETLLKAINEKKAEPFKLSYVDNNDLYLVIGYGSQPTGGYSIVVDELFTTENTIVFGTTLKGPWDKADMQDAETYPYIAVKTEYIDCEIVFK